MLFLPKKKELVFASVLCLSFCLATAGAIISFTEKVNAFSKPKVHAQKVKGVATHTVPTSSPTLTPTPTKPKQAKTIKPSPTISNVQKASITPTITETVGSNSVTSTTPTPTTQSSTSNNTSDILAALNAYRAKKGKGALSIDGNLQSFAESRVAKFDSQGSMDNHAGFSEMMAQDGFSKMGFNALGENSSYGAFGSAQNLIEGIYAGHGPHDENQLKSEWTHVGIGVKGVATDFVFGGRKR